MTHLGIRCLRSREGDYNDATKFGAQIFTREMIRDMGAKMVVEQMPKMNNIYVSIDIDGLCPSIAPGTGSPTVDGLLYHEVRALLQGVAAKGRVVGFDVVEVNPMLDLHGQTSLLTTTMIAEFLGRDFRPATVTARWVGIAVAGGKRFIEREGYDMRRTTGLIIALAAGWIGWIAPTMAAAGTLKVAVGSNLNTLDPAKTKIGEEYIINFLVFSGLTEIGRDGRVNQT